MVFTVRGTIEKTACFFKISSRKPPYFRNCLVYPLVIIAKVFAETNTLLPVKPDY